MKTRKLLIAVTVASALVGVSAGANADLIQNGELDIAAQGFGNAHRLLTISSQGSTTFESGAIGVASGAIVALTTGIDDGLVFSGNGVQNAGGDTVNPLNDTLKHGIPTLGSLNWTSGVNVNLLFNATEPGGDGLSITDVTLKFYDGDSVIAAIDGNFAYADTLTGNGSAGFLISVDVAQQTYLDNTVFNQSGFSDFRIALESTITGVAGGPESFSAVETLPHVTTVPEPETYLMMLTGLGLIGFVGARRTKTRK